MTVNTKISAGEVIVLTTGEYSDYCITGYIVARIDFDMREAINIFQEQAGQDEGRNDHGKFIAWLVSTERVVPVQHREMHIGSYGELEIEEHWEMDRE